MNQHRNAGDSFMPPVFAMDSSAKIRRGNWSSRSRPSSDVHAMPGVSFQSRQVTVGNSLPVAAMLPRVFVPPHFLTLPPELARAVWSLSVRSRQGQ